VGGGDRTAPRDNESTARAAAGEREESATAHLDPFEQHARTVARRGANPHRRADVWVRDHAVEHPRFAFERFDLAGFACELRAQDLRVGRWDDNTARAA